MARDHRKHNSKLYRSSEKHKSRRSDNHHQSPLRVKTHKVRKSRLSEVKNAPQAQQITLNDAQIHILAEQLAQMQGLFSKKEAPPAKTVTLTKTAEQSSEGTKIKPKKTVSIAGIFQNADQRVKEKTKKKMKTPSPKHPLLSEFHNGLEHAYTDILDSTSTAFDEIHAGFQQRIDDARRDDAKLIASVTEATQVLSTSLMDEQVQVQRIRNGKRVSETVVMGDQIDAFKKLIEKESMKQTELWKQWEAIRDEYNQLAREVFGTEISEEYGMVSMNQHRERDNDLDKELHTTNVELNNEVDELCERSLKQMKTTERELDLAAKKEQELLLRHCLFS